jgi:hypothetical protein
MNEASIEATLTFAKGLAAANENQVTTLLTIAGEVALQTEQTIGTTDQTLVLGDITTIGYLFFRNLETAVLLVVSDPPSITNIGTAGAATWSYKIVSKDANGNYTAASAAGTTTTGNATLNGTNFNRLGWTADPAASSYDVYRTAHGTTPSTTGFIGNTSSTTFDDTGLAGDSSTAPSVGSEKIVQLGGDGTDYPTQVRAGLFALVEWNAAAVHAKATSAGPAFCRYTILSA